ncbi:hypothetical protein HDV05_000896 [Chytridiales sp. JEL 0842]|nr:hypothetical protein HDV05_000896 [Chytridiales sp. JEL 0842]
MIGNPPPSVSDSVALKALPTKATSLLKPSKAIKLESNEQPPPTSVFRTSRNLRDPLPPEVRHAILDASDPLTQYLNAYGPYSRAALGDSRTSNKVRRHRRNEIWIEAVHSDWQGKLSSLPGWFASGREYYPKVPCSESMYQQLEKRRAYQVQHETFYRVARPEDEGTPYERERPTAKSFNSTDKLYLQQRATWSDVHDGQYSDYSYSSSTSDFYQEFG